jgi:hypothetical protein
VVEALQPLVLSDVAAPGNALHAAELLGQGSESVLQEQEA